MPSFVVDPVLCTTPEADEVAAVAGWLSALEAWLDAVESSPFEWRHVHRCSLALVEMGRFPSFESLRHARSVAGSDVNTGGLLRKISRFFQNEERDLLAVTATQCLIVADGQPLIAPPLLLARNLGEVRAPLTDGLLCIACDKAAGEPFARGAHLVTLPFTGQERDLLVAGSVGLVDPGEMSTRLGRATVEERFPLLFSPDELSSFDHEALLAEGEEGLPARINSLAVTSYASCSPLEVRLGSQFWRSLHKTGIIEDVFVTRKLLKICAGIIADRLEEMNVDRRFKRTTMAADSPQQTRKSDEAKAWRLTLTKHGAGYRLHYWHVPASAGREAHIELANVLRETDPVVIPEN